MLLSKFWKADVMVGVPAAMLDYKAIGRRIKYFRTQKIMTQSSLAERLSVTDKYICSVENGRTKVSLPRLYEIADVLDVDITFLLKDVNPESASYINCDIIEATKNWSSQKKLALLKIIEGIGQL